jgi:hypothetical protein
VNWNDPAARAALIERVGPDEYNRLHGEHWKSSAVAVVNGRPIRRVGSRFGPLYAVEGTGRAFKTLELASDFAMEEPS